jgi:hypothetical protein
MPSSVVPPDSATVLAHAYGNVTGALLDFKAEIQKATDANDASAIAILLSELVERTFETQAFAMRTVCALNSGRPAA